LIVDTDVPGRPTASEESTALGIGGDEALVADELVVEEISIDGMCGVY
jgi:mycofactocin precursor